MKWIKASEGLPEKIVCCRVPDEKIGWLYFNSNTMINIAGIAELEWLDESPSGDQAGEAAEIERLKFSIMILEGENRKLRDDKLKIQKEAGLDPYWYWPQCDVDGCEQVSCCGGTCWRETGYWNVCPDHSKMHRSGSQQPKMKDAAIEKEKTRLADGTLPNNL